MARQMDGEEVSSNMKLHDPMYRYLIRTIFGPADQELVVMSKVSRRFRKP
jgi:hypothetical protein